jgi:hypothetical protein
LQLLGENLSAAKSVHSQWLSSSLTFRVYILDSWEGLGGREEWGFLSVVKSIHSQWPRGSRPLRVYTKDGHRYPGTSFVLLRNGHQVPHLAPPGGYQRYFGQVPAVPAAAVQMALLWLEIAVHFFFSLHASIVLS